MSTDNEPKDAMSVSFADPELEHALASAKAWEDTAAVYARNDLDRQADIAQLRARLAEVEAERDAALASKANFVAMLELAPKSRLAMLAATRRELDDCQSIVALYEAEVAKLNRIIDEITAAHVDADQMWAKERRERITAQTVVEAAVEWRRHVGDYPLPANHLVGDLIAAVDSYQSAASCPQIGSKEVDRG